MIRLVNSIQGDEGKNNVCIGFKYAHRVEADAQLVIALAERR